MATLPYAEAYVTYTGIDSPPSATPKKGGGVSGRLISSMISQPGHFDYVNSIFEGDSVTSRFLFTTPALVDKAFGVVSAQVNNWIPEGQQPPDIRRDGNHLYVTESNRVALG
jgi:hypothetical protein